MIEGQLLTSFGVFLLWGVSGICKQLTSLLVSCVSCLKEFSSGTMSAYKKHGSKVLTVPLVMAQEEYPRIYSSRLSPPPIKWPEDQFLACKTGIKDIGSAPSKKG